MAFRTVALDPQLRALIQALHDSPVQAAFVVSGGGSQALAWLLGVPGASRTVLEVVLPYSSPAFERFIGFQPKQFVSQETAVDLAKVAYHRARLLAVEGTPSVGLACTATLVTDRPKRGEHRCHVAVRDEAGVTAYSLVLTKGARDRAGEEDVVSCLILRALAEACHVPDGPPLALLPGEHVETARLDAPDQILRVLRGEFAAVVVEVDRQISIELPRGVVCLPGAFHPLHAGHLQLAYVAGQMTGLPVCYELSARNVDKPPLAEADVRQRLDQFAGRGRVVLTAAPLFVQKAALLPESVFVVGYDTATRLVNAQYYGDDEAAMRASLATIRDLGCRFLVAGRLYEGRFRTLQDVAIPAGFDGLFAAIPPDLFRADVSSTELRQLRVRPSPD